MYLILNSVSAMSRFLGFELCRRFSDSMVSVEGNSPGFRNEFPDLGGIDRRNGEILKGGLDCVFC